jgi:alanine racemase
LTPSATSLPALPSRPATWVDVDLACLERNARVLARLAAVPLMAVVKANGYGHGALAAAAAALRGGAAWCGVARPEEALELRRGGIGCPILLLGWSPPQALPELIAAGVSLTVWSTEQVSEIAAAARSLGRRARLHLKLDTGMSRLGLPPEEIVELARAVAHTDGVTQEGLFTHYACADDPSSDVTADQERRLREAAASLAASGLGPGLVHAANSAATLKRPTSRFDLVRVGIALYGLEPSPTCPLPGELQAALSWRAVLTQVKTLPAGRGVSYGHAYTTSRSERIGTVAVGYGDGFRRSPGNLVLVAGERVPVVGRVCMDQILVQLDSVPQAKAGDEVVLIGAQSGGRLRAEDLARAWGTISYEVVCGITARVPRRHASAATSLDPDPVSN